MTINTAEYRMSTTVDLPYGRAVERTREELAKEGFGVLTEIDGKSVVAAMTPRCRSRARGMRRSARSPRT